MKTILILILFLFSVSLFAQDAKEILRKGNDKCFSIQNGYYEMTKRVKWMSHKDTTSYSFICYFKKLTDDTLSASAFNSTVKYDFKGKAYSYATMYTGNERVTLDSKDSSGTIKSKEKWGDNIMQYRDDKIFYAPFTQKAKKIYANYPLPHDSDFIDNRHTFKFIGEEKINNNPCYHVQVNVKPENDSADDMKELRREYHFWIKKDDFLPVQYSIAIDVFMDNDTMYQYEEFLLTKYELNNLKDETPLTLESIPAYYKLKDYVPHKRPELLPNDTIAPGWNLISLKGEKVDLSELKGKLVLIDFFYKSCYPCMQALPALQALSEKYKDKGLKLIGIDPYDKKEDLEVFLAKRGVTYTILLDGLETAKKYRVSVYPTIYLIDKNGKIISNLLGYGKDTEKELEEIIKTHL
jgi:thiol-disulfide isomerase/thioredoxin